MKRSPLHIETYPDVVEEIERLRDGGYERRGTWSLGQICEHLSYYYAGSLDGYGFMLPWLVRVLFGRRYLRRILERGDMRSAARTIPKSLPPEDIDEDAAIDRAISLLSRLEQATYLHPSPLAGELPLEQSRRLNLIHSEHHLRFLSPRGDG